ncbi:FAD/NAD(P)-binding domain-containing protein [Aspergillus uvarum CBS 121591]|uniref:FAD/NAD(P)-binding domain-containing protein n=1 Tax=Aspergillus uvarum CBS 121591 TaxID=1448315 RepID=A0A319CZ63_9EURO|nr:FAD/NAD(P)-binding domain-containing protein [Aspergillus uvarum CBS 121591]PYH80918.1 FAD/NAD(P)-binding domain-containing protein [Aspergillus uvarum CBS 121591]
MPVSQPERVAIIGGGCTGITSFWALQNSGHDVHLFEASDALGGRIKSLPFEHEGIHTNVNSESSVYNVEASPNLDSLLRYLGVSTIRHRFGVRATDGDRNSWWSDSILQSILLRPWILCRKETYVILSDIIWLKFIAIDVLRKDVLPYRTSNIESLLSAKRYLAKEGYSASFRDEYLAPTLSVLWGTNAGKVLSRLPIEAAIRCLYDHQLLWPRQNVPWRSIERGVSHLVQALSRDFDPSRVHLEARVRRVTRYDKKVYRLVTADGRARDFNRIIFAVDSEEIMQILGPLASAQDRKIIGGLGTTKNISVLHSDSLLLLEREHSTTAYTYVLEPIVPERSSEDSTPRKSSLSYNVNALDSVSVSLYGPIYITLNPIMPPHPSIVQSVCEFTEPDPSFSTLQAQNDLALIQNKQGLSYGFRWTGRGHLEDAITAGLRVAIEDLNAEVPFPVEFHPIPFAADLPRPSLGLPIHIIRTLLRLLQLFVLVLKLLMPLLPGPASRFIVRRHRHISRQEPGKPS